MKIDQHSDNPENIQHLFSEIAKSITASLEMSEIINAVMKILFSGLAGMSFYC